MKDLFFVCIYPLLIFIIGLSIGAIVVKAEANSIMISDQEIMQVADPAFCGNDVCRTIINRWKNSKIVGN